MNAKGTVVETIKRLVAEILGDGALAEQGSQQIARMLRFPYLAVVRQVIRMARHQAPLR